MDTARVRIEDVKRGDMIPGWCGVVIADTLSVNHEGNPLWFDTDGQRHMWGGDGYAVVYVPKVRTQAVGRSSTGGCHILANGIPGQAPVAVCGTGAALEIWESGIALASVTCKNCRRLYNLVGGLRH